MAGDWDSRRGAVQAPSPDARLRSIADASRAIAGARTLEELLAVVTEAAQAVIGTHQAIITRLIEGWGDSHSYLALSEKYAEFRAFDQPPKASASWNMWSATTARCA
jgi:GAF domain-containing protein